MSETLAWLAHVMWIVATPSFNLTDLFMKIIWYKWLCCPVFQNLNTMLVSTGKNNWVYIKLGLWNAQNNVWYPQSYAHFIWMIRCAIKTLGDRVSLLAATWTQLLTKPFLRWNNYSLVSFFSSDKSETKNIFFR